MTVTNKKPSRSDEVLDADDQIQISNQIRAQFDALAPKRPTKPNRSEPVDPFPQQQHPLYPTISLPIPELHKLQSLQSQSHAVLSKEGRVADEFVETEYYKELASIDKQHHATGTGFIKVAREGGESGGYEIQIPENHESETKIRGYSSNPATNDWVPSQH